MQLMVAMMANSSIYALDDGVEVIVATVSYGFSER